MLNDRKQKVIMKAVLYVMAMICNLISVSKARRSGFKITFDGDEENNGFCEIMHKKTERVYLRGIGLSEGLYEAVFIPTERHKALVSTRVKQDVHHNRLVHISTAVMAKTAPIVKDSGSLCEECQVGKSCRQPRPIATEESRKSTAPIDFVHVDIFGPMKHPSFAGKKYFIPMYHDNSAASLVRFIRSRDEASRAIQV